jgi:Rieske Fe-S protein
MAPRPLDLADHVRAASAHARLAAPLDPVTDPVTPGPTSRRGVLSAAAVVGAASGLVLIGCGSSGGSGDSASASASSAPTITGAGAPASGDTSAPSSGETGAASSGGTVLGPTSEIPVGGGMIFPAAKVVVTQPSAGTFKAFSSTCTHQGCQVNKVVDGRIKCPCHGSQYNIADGSVAAGPAPKPLPAAPVTVRGTSLVLGG